MKKIIFVILLCATGFAASAQPRLRPTDWATPILSEKLSNWHQLDGKVFRSSQPSKRGFAEAIQLGIKSVLNLRDNHSDDDEAKGLTIKTYRVRMEAGDIKEDDVVKALKIIKSSEGPILIHCWHGSDRTGLVCASYRMVFQNWTKQAALDELANGGYGYHKTLYKNIARWIENADVEALKKKVFEP